MHRRLQSHDYAAVGTYMLTLVVAGRRPVFGHLSGDAEVPSVVLSELGKAVRDEEQQKISRYYPMVEVWKLCIMPDHLHLIVRVKAPMGAGKHLGQVVSGFKTGCSRAWWRLTPCGEPQGTGAYPAGAASASAAGGSFATVPGGSPPGPSSAAGSSSAAGPSSAAGSSSADGGSSSGSSLAPSRRSVLFEKGYCDKILLREGQLENWKRYLDDNPRRLFIKRLHPEYFTVLHQVKIMDLSCQLIGNRFLLDIPDKAAVIVHRAYSDQEFEDYRRRWLALGEAGGVLISAAIAPREKAVMREAMNRGYQLILLRENGFPPLYKPSGETFAACSEGRLLQISPWEYRMQRHTISREQCLILNRLAEYIATISI